MSRFAARSAFNAAFPWLVPAARKGRDTIVWLNEGAARSRASPPGSSYPLSSIIFHGERGASEISAGIYRAVVDALASPESLPDQVYQVDGMSGRAYRDLLNGLVRALSAKWYLEIGSFKGSTVIAALSGNDCRAACIDNWSGFGGPKGQFIRNIEECGIADRIDLIESDFRKVDFRGLGTFDIFFYDGPHEERDHIDGLVLPQPALKDEYVLLVDDWNWLPVRMGTFRALSRLRSRILFAVELRTSEANRPPVRLGKESDWHNDCFVAAVRKA